MTNLKPIRDCCKHSHHYNSPLIIPNKEMLKKTMPACFLHGNNRNKAFQYCYNSEFFHSKPLMSP